MYFGRGIEFSWRYLLKSERGMSPSRFFKEYLQYGYYPFYLKNQMDYYTSIEQVTNFIIESELPQLCGVDIGNVRKLKALLGILATSVPFEVDISKLSTTIGIHRNTVIEYLNSLERAKLLRLLYADLLSVKRCRSRIRYIWIILICSTLWLPIRLR